MFHKSGMVSHSYSRLKVFNILFKLPESTLLELFGKWLSVIDISALDCAMCSNTAHNNFAREYLGRIISQSSELIPFQDSSRVSFSVSYWTWLVKRNIFVKMLNFCDTKNVGTVLRNFTPIIIKELKERILNSNSNSEINLPSDLNIISFKILNRVEEIRFVCTTTFNSKKSLKVYKRLSIIFTNLKILTLEGGNIGDAELSSILETNSHCLRKLVLSACSEITGIDISPLLFSNIKELEIDRCLHLNEDGWNNIIMGLKNLTYLDFSSRNHYFPVGISMLRITVSNLINLKTLYIGLKFGEFDDFSGIGFPQTINNFHVIFYNNITEIQLNALLSNNLPNTLEYLELSSDQIERNLYQRNNFDYSK
eukprot:gene5661-7817_t